MSRLPDDLVRRADSDLSGHVPNQFMRHLLEFASSGVQLHEVCAFAEKTYLWYREHARTGPIPSRMDSTATTSSGFSSRSELGPTPSSSRTSVSFDSGYDRPAWSTIPEDSSPVINNTPPHRQGSQQVYRASKALLGKLNTSPDFPSSFRKGSCTSDAQCSGNTVKTYTCPWCQIGCKRPGELKKHFEHQCGSQKVFVCSKCGTGAQSKRHAEKLLKSSGPCQHTLHEFTLDYHRRGFSCPGCGQVSLSLEDHSNHFLDCCKDLGLTSLEQRNLQIRNLLDSAHLRNRVRRIWRKLGLNGQVSTQDLSWSFDKPTCATRLVERLEYGERDVTDGIPSFGFTSARIDEYLTELISKGLPSKPDPVLLMSSALSGQTWTPSQTWTQRQPLMIVPSPVHGTGTSPLFESMRCASPQSLLSTHLHRNNGRDDDRLSESLSTPVEATNHSYEPQPNQSHYNNHIEPSFSTPKYPGPPVPPKTPILQQPDAQMMDFDNNTIAFDQWTHHWSADTDLVPGTFMGYINSQSLRGQDGMPF